MSDSARSPFAGCIILIAAAVMLIFLVGYSLWVPFRQASEIEKFTQASAAPVPQLEVEENQEFAIELVDRLTDFQTKLGTDQQSATLELDARDINLAIARFPLLEELRGAFFVREITQSALIIDICYQLNGRPRLTRDDEDGMIASDPRYLIGILRGRPVVTDKELVLQVDSLDIPGSEVPEGFMGHFSTLRIFEKGLDDPVIGPAMAQLSKAEIVGDRLILSRVVGETSPGVISEADFQKSGGKIAVFLGGAALLFLMVAGTILYLGYRTQMRRLSAKDQTGPEPPGA